MHHIYLIAILIVLNSDSITWTENSSEFRNNLKIWVNVFIPNNLSDNQNFIYQITRNPKYKNISALKFNEFGIKGYFLTDNRYFSFDSNASSRLHQEISLNPSNMVVSCSRTVIGKTTMLNFKNESTICEKTADIGKSKVNYTRHSENQLAVSMMAGVSNPCIPLSPDIDIDLNFVVTNIQNKIRIDMLGTVDAFPYYEIYARLDDQSPKILYRSINFNMNGITTPWDLFKFIGEERELEKSLVL